MLQNKEIPGWLYPVTRGATTIWETWEGYDPSGQPFASHNHYAFGAVMEWVYRYVVGIDTRISAPGYKEFTIRPCPGGGLTYAGAAIETVRGTVACRWTLEGNQFTLDVTVPSNTRAEIQLPEMVRRVADASGLAFNMKEGSYSTSAAAGTYKIVCSL